jgi:hypothetical protein
MCQVTSAKRQASTLSAAAFGSANPRPISAGRWTWKASTRPFYVCASAPTTTFARGAAEGAGQIVDEDTYGVDFPLDGHTLIVEATFVSGTEILIGTHLLRQYRLEINFPARTVLLERVP